jgi:hypothetical protein
MILALTAHRIRRYTPDFRPAIALSSSAPSAGRRTGPTVADCYFAHAAMLAPKLPRPNPPWWIAIEVTACAFSTVATKRASMEKYLPHDERNEATAEARTEDGSFW